MGLNVSTTMGFENYEFLKGAAQNMSAKGGASSDASSKSINSAISGNANLYTNPQLSIIEASTQISVNNSLNETLKYLKSHANKKVYRKHVLGELWSIVCANNESADDNQYHGELYNFEIDESAKNIFAA